jgi:uncharacterized 2Fe-2S/4Fe-4S cluster protein (DUF4445 family)
MHKVTVNGRVLYAENGQLLSDVLIASGERVEHPCGGKGICKKCLVAVNGEKVLSCRYAVRSDVSVELNVIGEITSDTGIKENPYVTENLCCVLDIGTTTLAMALVSTDTGKTVRGVTRTNPQRIFGADVMSRIEYCTKNGIYDMQKSVIDVVNYMLEELSVESVSRLYVSGNTTMLHIFFGVDVSGLGVAPYDPVFLESRIAKGESLGIDKAEEIVSLPSISTFVGADIVAGLNFVGLPDEGKYNLLIDLGTNAEIVLFNENAFICTSAAAGPCFEGANISCGMSAVSGAVCTYSDDEVRTIGNSPAKGICGTGLVDVIATLVNKSVIDETGYMEGETFRIADGVELTQADVRQYQLAKSAVYSAIMTLMRLESVTAENIGTVYISGGFSVQMNIANAIRTGLLPESLKDKCKAISNSSLLGTLKYAVENNDLSAITEKSRYVDLAADPHFSDLFIENMMFI